MFRADRLHMLRGLVCDLTSKTCYMIQQYGRRLGMQVYKQMGRVSSFSLPISYHPCYAPTKVLTPPKALSVAAGATVNSYPAGHILCTLRSHSRFARWCSVQDVAAARIRVAVQLDGKQNDYNWFLSHPSRLSMTSCTFSSRDLWISTRKLATGNKKDPKQYCNREVSYRSNIPSKP